MAIPSAPTTRNQAADLMERGVRKVFFNEVGLDDNQFSEIYNVTTSQKRQETDVVMAGLGSFFMKAEGDQPQYDSLAEAWKVAYLHRTWALGLEITREALEDELYGVFQAMGKELGIAARYTQEVQAADLFNDLTQTVYTAGGTNYPLLSTAQFRLDGGSYANRPTTATDLSIDSLETALAAWRTNLVDQRGRKLASMPEILVVGPSDEMLAERLLMSSQRPQGNDNDVNAVKSRRKLRLFVWDFLTDDGRWFLMGPKAQRGLNWFKRVGYQMDRVDDPNTGNLRMVARYRESHGASHPGAMYGSP